jgi:hypothetical protein
MTAVFLEDRYDENLCVEAISGGSRGDGREPLDPTELRELGCGCLQGLELSSEQATVSDLEGLERRLAVERLAVERLARIAESRCV